MAPRWVKITQDDASLAPRGPKTGQGGLRRAYLRLDWLRGKCKLAQGGPKIVPCWPKMTQDDPRWPQDGPKMAQDGPKMAQERPKRGPRGVPKGSQIAFPRPSNIEARKGSVRVNLKCRFGEILGPFWGPYRAYVGPKKGL